MSKDVFNSLAACRLDGYIVVIPVSVSVTLTGVAKDSAFYEFLQKENDLTDKL